MKEVRRRALIFTVCAEVLLPKKWEVKNKSFTLLPFVTFAFGLLKFLFAGKHLKYCHLIFLSQLSCWGGKRVALWAPNYLQYHSSSSLLLFYFFPKETSSRGKVLWLVSSPKFRDTEIVFSAQRLYFQLKAWVTREAGIETCFSL